MKIDDSNTSGRLLGIVLKSVVLFSS